MQNSFSATFHLGTFASSVLTCTYLFHQETDATGNAVAKVLSGDIELLIEGSDDTLPLAWAADPMHKMDGEIIFFQGDERFGVAERLSFTEGSCVSYTEIFEPMHPISSYLYRLKIVANKLVLNGLEHSNDWPDQV